MGAPSWKNWFTANKRCKLWVEGDNFNCMSVSEGGRMISTECHRRWRSLFVADPCHGNQQIALLHLDATLQRHVSSEAYTARSHLVCCTLGQHVVGTDGSMATWVPNSMVIVCSVLAQELEPKQPILQRVSALSRGPHESYFAS